MIGGGGSGGGGGEELPGGTYLLTSALWEQISGSCWSLGTDWAVRVSEDEKVEEHRSAGSAVPDACRVNYRAVKLSRTALLSFILPVWLPFTQHTDELCATTDRRQWRLHTITASIFTDTSVISLTRLWPSCQTTFTENQTDLHSITSTLIYGFSQ